MQRSCQCGSVRIRVGSIVIATSRHRDVGQRTRDYRRRIVTALVNDGTVQRSTSVGDGVHTTDLPIAIVAFFNGLHGVHRQGLAAGGGVESLHGSLRREGGSVGVAAVHIRLVARPGARQSGSRRLGDIVGVGPVLGVAFAVLIHVGVGHRAGAAVIVHRLGGRKRRGDVAIAVVLHSRHQGGIRVWGEGVGDAGHILRDVSRVGKGFGLDGIDIAPRGGLAGAVGIGVSIGTGALAGKRVRVVHRAGEHTCNGSVLALAGGRRDGSGSRSLVNAVHRLGSLNARGIHRGSSGAVDGIDEVPDELAVHAILVCIGVGNRALAIGDVFGSHQRGVRQLIAAHILHHWQRGGSGGGTHTFHYSRSGHRTVDFSRRSSTLDGVGVGPSRCLVVTILIGIDKLHRAFAGHRVGGTG